MNVLIQKDGNDMPQAMTYQDQPKHTGGVSDRIGTQSTRSGWVWHPINVLVIEGIVE